MLQNFGKQNGIEDASSLYNNAHGPLEVEDQWNQSAHGSSTAEYNKNACETSAHQDMHSLYIETNRMLKELHFERLRRLAIEKGEVTP